MNLNDTSPYPKNIEYKLRFNPDYTPSTARIKSRYVSILQILSFYVIVHHIEAMTHCVSHHIKTV